MLATVGVALEDAKADAVAAAVADTGTKECQLRGKASLRLLV